MAKKGKALGRDPLFWVRDTRKEQPGTSEEPPPEDTPTAGLESGPRPATTPRPAQGTPPSAPHAETPAPAPPAIQPASVWTTPTSLPPGAAAPPEIREPRAAFLVLVLMNILLLLALGVIGYLHLSRRLAHLEQRVERLAPRPAAPME